MKLLFVTNSLGSGGAERVLTSLANHWIEKNNQITILCFDKEKSFYPLNERILVKYLDVLESHTSLFKKLEQKISIILKLAKFFRVQRPDIAISFIDTTNILAILAATLSKTKIIVSERIHCTYLKSFFWLFLRRVVYQFASGLVVLSKKDYNYYKFVKERKIIFNPAWLIDSHNTTIKKENMILSVGRLEHQKGYEILFKALAKLSPKDIQDWKVVIIGSGSLEKELKKLTLELGLEEKVTFAGITKNIVNYYLKAAIFVSTSRSEGFPNALCEALTMGCACLATDCPTGPAELITNNINGFLVPIDNTEAVAKKLKLLLRSDLLRKNLSIQAVKSTARFSINQITKDWESFFKIICKDSTVFDKQLDAKKK